MLLVRKRKKNSGTYLSILLDRAYWKEYIEYIKYIGTHSSGVHRALIGNRWSLSELYRVEVVHLLPFSLLVDSSMKLTDLNYLLNFEGFWMCHFGFLFYSSITFYLFFVSRYCGFYLGINFTEKWITECPFIGIIMFF